MLKGFQSVFDNDNHIDLAQVVSKITDLHPAIKRARIWK
jgi:hypothetical protein